MTIFQFLRLLQSALCSGLFRRKEGTSLLRYVFASTAAAAALGLPYADDGCIVEFCPITLVHAFLGYTGGQYQTTQAYRTTGTRLGLPQDLRENIVAWADIEPYEVLVDGERVYSPDYHAPRTTLDSIETATQAVPRGWSCAG